MASAGEIHYARVARELWRERLFKMKRVGFNTVATLNRRLAVFSRKRSDHG